MRILITLVTLLGLALAEQSVNFGLEFMTTGIVCSAALPNGTAIGLTRVDGGEEYRTVMYRMFTEARAGGEIRDFEQKQQQQERQIANYWGWGWTWPELPTSPSTSDDPVKTLSKAVAHSKRECIKTLSKEHAVEVTEMLPKVYIAVPSWLSTRVPRSRRVVTTFDWRMWLRKQLDALERAVEEGGYMLAGDGASICSATEAALYSLKHIRREQHVIAAFHAEGITIWIQGQQEAWSTIPTKNWEENVHMRLPKVIKDTLGADLRNITLVPIGSSWTSPRLKTLSRIMEEVPLNVTIRRVDQLEYAASLGAAKVAT